VGLILSGARMEEANNGSNGNAFGDTEKEKNELDFKNY
jgi:hypothetical protein